MKNIDDLKAGQIIRIKDNINRLSPTWVYTYYKLTDDWFEITSQTMGLIGKFKGLHFLGMGSTYFHHTANNPIGLEVIQEENCELVDDLPTDLIP